MRLRRLSPPNLETFDGRIDYVRGKYGRTVSAAWVFYLHVLAVACPACKALPGEACLVNATRDGIVPGYHATRAEVFTTPDGFIDPAYDMIPERRLARFDGT